MHFTYMALPHRHPGFVVRPIATNRRSDHPLLPLPIQSLCQAFAKVCQAAPVRMGAGERRDAAFSPDSMHCKKHTGKQCTHTLPSEPCLFGGECEKKKGLISSSVYRATEEKRNEPLCMQHSLQIMANRFVGPSPTK